MAMVLRVELCNSKEIKPFGKFDEVFVIVNNAPLFEKPNVTSKELMRLPLFTRIRILDNRDTNLSPFV